MEGHQLRKFKIHKNINEKEKFQQIFSKSFEDIYIYKKGITKIGIKIRNPKQKQYGWKINAIQIKQRVDKQEKQSLLQQWKKQIFDFEAKIKLGDMQKFNKKLVQFIKQNVEIRNKELNKWLQQDIDDLYSIRKNKVKGIEGQQGQIKLISILKSQKEEKSTVYYFRTQSVEGSKQNVIEQIQNGNYKTNFSYPDLLQSVAKEQLKFFE